MQGMCQAPQCCAALQQVTAGRPGEDYFCCSTVCLFVCHCLAVGSLEQVSLPAYFECMAVLRRGFLGAFFWCTSNWGVWGFGLGGDWCLGLVLGVCNCSQALAQAHRVQAFCLHPFASWW